MINEERLFGMIAISKKAGKLFVGEARAEEVIRSGKADVIILSEDASDNTKKQFWNMASFRNIPIVYIKDRYTFGRIIGKKFAVSAVISDKGLSQAVIRLSGQEVKTSMPDHKI